MVKKRVIKRTNYTLPNATNDTPRDDNVLCHIESQRSSLLKEKALKGGRGQVQKQLGRRCARETEPHERKFGRDT